MPYIAAFLDKWGVRFEALVHGGCRTRTIILAYAFTLTLALTLTLTLTLTPTPTPGQVSTRVGTRCSPIATQHAPTAARRAHCCRARTISSLMASRTAAVSPPPRYPHAKPHPCPAPLSHSKPSWVPTPNAGETPASADPAWMVTARRGDQGEVARRHIVPR